MSRPRGKVGGVKETQIRGEVGRRPAQAAVDRIGNLAARLALDLEKEELEEARSRVAAFSAAELDWVENLVTLFHHADPMLLVVRSFDSVLDMAIAHALPGVAVFGDENLDEIADKVQRLHELKYDNGRWVFPSPFDPDTPGEENNRQQLTGRLGELSGGMFDDFLAGEAWGAASLRDYVWRSPRTIEAEATAELTKFLQRGRAVGENKGPPCPRCGSRDTIVVTMQLRRNDEAATSEFFCHSCNLSAGRG